MARLFKTGITSDGDIIAGINLKSNYQSGDEGGEIFLNKPVTNTTLVTGVTIDVNGDRLRFFENGGTNRGYYIDLASGGTSVGTNLVGGGGGSGTVTSITASSPLTGGTITTSGTIGINAASANTANYVVQRDGSGNFAANQATLVSQKFGLDAGAPSFNSYTAGVRTILYDNIGAASAGYAIGINSGEFWHTTSDTTGSFKWYGGITLAATLTGTGALTTVGDITGAGLVAATSTAQYPVGLNLIESSHATSRRTAISLGSQWQIGADSAGNGTRDFFIYGNGAQRLGISTDGIVTASTFSGSGASLTSLNGSNISSGTVADARIASALTGKTYNGLTVTTTTGTLTVASGKTLTASNSLTLAGTDGRTMTFPSTNATIARTDAAQTFTGTQTLGGVSVVNGGVFSFSGNSTTSGTSTLTNVPGTVAYATTSPSMIISVLTANATTNTGTVGAEFRASATTTTHLITFSSGTTARGSISTNSTTTTYSTSSDYRLKENVQPITGALDRLMLLKPSRFNFIEFPDRVVDGFIAHEAQEVVPESVVGSKDETNEDGSPAYQGIDQSKLVPLLTAALQEAILRIEALEAQVQALSE
jgi:hypothetical protein